MALIVPDEGEQLLLKYMLNKAAMPASVYLNLYKTAGAGLSESTVYSDFTTEGTWAGAGYAPIALVNASWTITSPGGIATATYGGASTFTFTGAGPGPYTVNGYFLSINDGGNKVLWAEAFPASFVLPSGGGTIVLTLKMELT